MPEPELIASIASTVMSTIVAVVALLFTYRQNVGWKPIALVTSAGLAGKGGSWQSSMHLTVELWNRRKYPLAFRRARASLTGVDILDTNGSGPEDRDYVLNNCALKEIGRMVQPSTSEKVEFKVSFDWTELNALKPLSDITITYFDPHKNREKDLHIKYRFFYPHLGWKYSDKKNRRNMQAIQQVLKNYVTELR